MKNFLIIALLISWSVFSDDETMHKDHESMQMMHHMHHFAQHSSTPVGTTGNMHHMGWMILVKQGLMNMSGNILDGDGISNADEYAIALAAGQNIDANTITNAVDGKADSNKDGLTGADIFETYN